MKISSISRPRRSVAALQLALLFTAIILMSSSSTRGMPAAQQSANPRNVPAPMEPECLGPGGAGRSLRHAQTNRLRFVGTDPDRPIAKPKALAGIESPRPEDTARAYFAACGALFGVSNASADLKVQRSEKADGGRSSVRFQQTHREIPVIGGELVANVDHAGNILSVGGKTLTAAGADLDTTPRIDPAAAAETARDLVAKGYRVEKTRLAVSTPELWIYDPALIGGRTGLPALVWRMEVKPLDIMPLREFVLIDARRGSVALNFNQVERAKNRVTYTAGGTTDLPGTLVCNESNPTCAGGDSHAIAAHQNAGDTYDFYLNVLGRDGINNHGMTIVSSVHYSAGYDNAFWDGAQMVYGDAFGFPLADDVVAHELTHGVTQYAANLLYLYQSGAINESISDVFGEFIDLTNGHGNDNASVRWQIGEDVSGMGPGRNMQDPTIFMHPDKMTSPYFETSSDDNGGVHANSGINNKAAYLIVDGGTFNGQTVGGLGVTKAARIYYETLTHLLVSASDYADLHEALYQGCINLIGTTGITATDCQQVRNATLAVEMNLPAPGGPFGPDAAICPAGQAPATLFFDNMENGYNNFLFSADVGDERWDLSAFYAHSGLTMLYGDDYPATITDTSAATANGVVLPANAYLHFTHAFMFEEIPDEPVLSFDGGVVEYSTNGGGSWLDAGPLFDTNGYNGNLYVNGSNPLAGRDAFTGDSHGYTASRVNLSSLAGQNVRFRWRMGLDENTSMMGWFLDDVRIYTCGAATPILTGVSPQSAAPGLANLNVAVTGQATHFAQGVTTASFGAGITINSVTVVDATHASVNITVAGGATPGLRNVGLTTGGEVATLVNGFAVGTPALTQIFPNLGQQSATSLDVLITGQYTNFINGQTTASFGAGVTVNTLLVINPATAVANLRIAGNAPLGARTVTLTTGIEAASLLNGFTVSAIPSITISDPTIIEGNSVSGPPAVFGVTLSQATTLPVTVNYATSPLTASSGTSSATFTNGAAITIPNEGTASPYPSTITVGAFSGIVTRVTASISGYTHTYPGDVDVLLQGPNGQTVVLMSDVGEIGVPVGGLNITFDDTASSVMGLFPTSGTFKPTNLEGLDELSDTFPASAPAGPYGSSMSVFNGVNPVGTWKLFVVDDAGGDSGSIAGGWSITISTATGDFVATSGTLTFAPGVTRMTLAVPTRGDTTVESNELFTVNLTSPVNATIAKITGSATILDDDGASPPAGSGAADLALDFGTGGFWGRYNNSTWNLITWSNPSLVASADIDGNRQSDVIADFPGSGVWARVNGASWILIHPLNVTAIAAADLDGNGQSDLILNFGVLGVWVYSNNSTFFQITPANPTSILTGDLEGDGRAEVIMNFSPGGVYTWSYASGLTLIHSMTASILATANMDGVGGDELVLGFPGFGLYTLTGGTTFKFLHTAIPARMVLADIDNNGQADIVADFTGFGVYTNKNLTGWIRIHALDVTSLAAGDIDNNGRADVLMAFPGSGYWAWTNDTTWTFVHSAAPEGVAVGKFD